jgi:TRAP-type C4-dicarboxylate transport system permease small subunit
MSDAADLQAMPAPVQMHPSRLGRLATALLEWGAVLLMSALAALVLANALGRYLFATPLPWTEEVVINILVWLAGVGIVLAAVNRSLICCDIVSARLSGSGARVLALICGLLGAGLMLYFSWLTWRYLMIFGRDLSPVLQIPKAVSISGLFFGTLGLAATLLIQIFKRKGE